MDEGVGVVGDIDVMLWFGVGVFGDDVDGVVWYDGVVNGGGGVFDDFDVVDVDFVD